MLKVEKDNWEQIIQREYDAIVEELALQVSKNYPDIFNNFYRGR